MWGSLPPIGRFHYATFWAKSSFARSTSWDSLSLTSGNNANFLIGERFDGRKSIPWRILPSSHARRTIDHRSNTPFDAKWILFPSFIDFILKTTKNEHSKICIIYETITFWYFRNIQALQQMTRNLDKIHWSHGNANLNLTLWLDFQVLFRCIEHAKGSLYTSTNTFTWG